MEISRKEEIAKDVNALIKASVGNKPVISVRELWHICVGSDKPINWIKSYKTLLKYVTVDYRLIFDPISKGHKSGTRYYIRSENVVEFLYRFETGNL